MLYLNTQDKCYATVYSEIRIFFVAKLFSLLTVTIYSAEERFNFIVLTYNPEGLAIVTSATNDTIMLQAS